MPKLYGALDPFTSEDCDRLHAGALRVLAETGCYVPHDGMLDRMRAVGHKVDAGAKVIRFDSEVVERDLAGCPNSLDRRPRPDSLIFSCDGGAGYVMDYGAREHRGATVRDLADFCRVADALDNIREISFPVFPRDVPYEIQDLTIWRHVWANTSKDGGGGLSRCGCVFMNDSPEAIRLLLRMAEVRYGGSARPSGAPLISGFVGASSPLRFDERVMNVMVELIGLDQTVGIGSNVIGGAQGPASLAGVVVMEHAERLAALSLAMAVNRSAHVYFCNHPNYLDMQTGNVANGSPEHSLMALCATGLLRRLGFQLIANHPAVQTGAQTPGVQASVERAMNAMLMGLGGASGVCACGAVNDSMSLEQLVIDNEIAGMTRRYLDGLDVTDETMGLDLIERVGIGGNFLGEVEVAQEARRSFWPPGLWNRAAYPSWLRDGASDALERAHAQVRDILANHHPEPLNDDQLKAMDAILAEAQGVLLADSRA